MSISRFGNKQPYEAYYVAFGFQEYLGSATIESATVTAVDDADGSDVTSAITTASLQTITASGGQEVRVWVKAGTTGHDYKLTCKVVASDGSLYELDATLPVVEA